MKKVSTYDWNVTDSGSLYKVFTLKRSWDDAQVGLAGLKPDSKLRRSLRFSLCADPDGAQLAVIDSDFKNAYVTGNCPVIKQPKTR